jgi:hypothetical protein
VNLFEASNLMRIVRVGPDEYAICLEDKQTILRALYFVQHAKKVRLAQRRLCPGDTELIDSGFTRNVVKLIENLSRRPKYTILFRKVAAPIDPAKDTSQAASTDIASRDSSIHTCAVEFRVLATIAATDNFLSLLGQIKRIKWDKSWLKVSLVYFARNAHRGFPSLFDILLIGGMAPL